MEGERMKKSWFLVLMVTILFVAVTMIIPGNSFAQKKPIVLRLVVPTPPGDYPLGTALDEMAKKFNARAKGEYKMEIHAGGALAKMPEYFDAVRIGAVEMSSVGWTIFSFLDQRLGVIEAPYLFASNDAALHAIKGLLPLYDQILQEKFNAKGLGLVVFTASEVISSKPVKKLEDVKGLLVGSVSPVASAMVKDLGGSPVTIMWPDLYESLQKNVVNATMSHVHAARVMNFFDACKYATLSFGPASFQGVAINLDIWKKMPKNIQKILQEEVDASNAWLGKMFVKLTEDDIKELTAKGVSFYWLPAAERDRWAKATAAYREKQLTSFGDFGAKVRQIADEANKKFPYKEGTYR
jgi:TRAP-type transport system periplasmic protein